MELREWATIILSADTIEGKLFVPTDPWTDQQPGEPLLWKEPARPHAMRFTKKTKEAKLPPFQDHKNPDNRAICLHRFAGHELLAVEIMAYALLAFPTASANFRRGLAHTLREEQEHVSLYIAHMKRLGINFGDLPLYEHFWKHTPYMKTPLHYISLMSLTFEMANLDFAPMYGQSFAKAGDVESAQLMATILKDEISHVRFGWQWLKQFKAKHVNEWQAWESILATTLVSPKRAKGFLLHEEHRLKSGLPQEWVENLKKY